VSAGRIEVWTRDEVHRFLAVAGGQTALHALLMLDCGFTAKDCSDLLQTEVDWKKGTVTRGRSKTAKLRRPATLRDDDQGPPVVTYKLWPRTFALLRKHRSADAEVVLLTAGGNRWVTESRDADGQFHRSVNSTRFA
jgi:integrase